MNVIKQVVAQLPKTAFKLAADQAVRSTTKQLVLDLARTIRSIGALASAVRAA